MRSTSSVAACCSSASVCSRESRSALVSSRVITELRRRAIFGVLGGLDVFFALPPNFCRLICLPRGSTEGIVPPQLPHLKGDVRFGSEADICAATSHVRFAPNSDHESGHVPMVMSALPPKADMCSAMSNVRYGPIADMPTIELPRPRVRPAQEGL